MWQTKWNSRCGIPLLEGSLLCAEEYGDLCRLTAEKCDEGHIAVICTVYGVMMQGLIFDAEAFPDVFEDLKKELAEFFERGGHPLEKESELRALLGRYTSTEVYRERMMERET